MKNYCSLQDPVKRLKREATHWEKILTNHISNKGFVSRMYKELLKLNVMKTNNPIRKCIRDKNRYFIEGIWMANKHMKDVQYH